MLRRLRESLPGDENSLNSRAGSCALGACSATCPRMARARHSYSGHFPRIGWGLVGPWRGVSLSAATRKGPRCYRDKLLMLRARDNVRWRPRHPYPARVGKPCQLWPEPTFSPSRMTYDGGTYESSTRSDSCMPRCGKALDCSNGLNRSSARGWYGEKMKETKQPGENLSMR